MREKAREIAIEIVKSLNTSSNGDFSYSQQNIAQFQIPNTQNPSLEKFNIPEEFASELAEFIQNEKLCTFEPGNKPCDHCSMCGSRGF